MNCWRMAPSQAWTPPAEPHIPIAADYFDVLGAHYLVVVDQFSAWPHIVSQPSGASDLIRALTAYFATFEVCVEISTDGGPEFMAKETQAFFSRWGVKHWLSSAYHPESNGWAEAAVKTVKRLLTSHRTGYGTIDTDAVAAGLLQHKSCLVGAFVTCSPWYHRPRCFTAAQCTQYGAACGNGRRKPCSFGLLDRLRSSTCTPVFTPHSFLGTGYCCITRTVANPPVGTGQGQYSRLSLLTSILFVWMDLDASHSATDSLSIRSNPSLPPTMALHQSHIKPVWRSPCHSICLAPQTAALLSQTRQRPCRLRPSFQILYFNLQQYHYRQIPLVLRLCLTLVCLVARQRIPPLLQQIPPRRSSTERKSPGITTTIWARPPEETLDMILMYILGLRGGCRWAN